MRVRIPGSPGLRPVAQAVEAAELRVRGVSRYPLALLLDLTCVVHVVYCVFCVFCGFILDKAEASVLAGGVVKRDADVGDVTKGKEGGVQGGWRHAILESTNV